MNLRTFILTIRICLETPTNRQFLEINSSMLMDILVVMTLLLPVLTTSMVMKVTT